MRHVLALLERDPDTQLTGAARSLGTLLGVGTACRLLPPESPADRARTVTRALAAEDVVAGALSARGTHPVCWEVITRTPVPLVVVPAASHRVVRRISRVLLPLDGDPATATAVSGFARRALASGVRVLAVHVFDSTTAPAFWDQAAHTHPQWTSEFQLRNLPRGAQLTLCRGRPAREVLEEARRGQVDLIVLAWRRDLGAGHAATVRAALAQAPAPVLLMGTEPGPSSVGGGSSDSERLGGSRPA